MDAPGGDVEHWAYAWLGRPYDAVRHDCATLVEDVLRERFDVALRLPGRAAGQRGRDAQIAAAADRAVPVEVPREGDVVLMNAVGRRDGVGQHAGIWCDVAGAAHVLHCVADAGTCLHPLAGLEARGYRVVKVYRALAPIRSTDVCEGARRVAGVALDPIAGELRPNGARSAHDPFPELMSGRAAVTLDTRPHPVTTEGRAVRRVAVAPGTTLAVLVAREGPRPPFEVAVDGRIVPPEQYPETPLADGQIVTLQAAVGDGGGTDPLRTVLQIAVIAAAIYVPGGQGFLGLGIESALGQALVGAAIGVVGGLVVNALVPPPALRAGGVPAGPEPVYSIIGASNQARPYSAIPLVCGTHRLWPDVSIAGYAEHVDDEQFFLGVFGCGAGANLHVPSTEWRIGEDRFDSYAGTRGFVRGPGVATTLVAGDVQTLTGGAVAVSAVRTLPDNAMTGVLEFERQTPSDTTEVRVDVAAQVVRVSDSGDYVSLLVQMPIAVYQRRSDVPPGTSVAPVQRSRVAVRSMSPDPRRLSVTIRLPRAGTWRVRIGSAGYVDPALPSDDPQVTTKMTVTGIRCYRADTGDYRGQTRIEIRIRASGQLSGRLDRLSVLAYQRIPVWVPAPADSDEDGSWVISRSSNPAWIFRWFALGIYDGGFLVAGAGLPESRLDDAGIRAWAAWCDTQELKFDYVVQNPMSVGAVLALIARAGDAVPSWHTGRLGVVYQDSARPVTALITPANVVAGSVSVEYQAGEVADEVVARWISPALDWQYDTVRRLAPGVTTPASTVTVTLDGVTTPRHAARACNLLAASQGYHRRRLRWTMGPGALTSIHRGDIVRITHSLLDGGVAGRLRSIAGQRLVLSAPVPASDGVGRLLLSLPTGALHETSFTRPADAAADVVDIAVALPSPAEGDRPWAPADVVWRYYANDTPPAAVRIVSVVPRVDGTVDVEAIDERAEFYTAGTANLDPGQTTARSLSVAVEGISLFRTPVVAGRERLVIVVTPGSRWAGGEIELSGPDPRLPFTWTVLPGYLPAARYELPFVTPGQPVVPGTYSVTVTPSPSLDGRPTPRPSSATLTLPDAA